MHGFSKATPNTLASRKIVVATRVDKKSEFKRHIRALNVSFKNWVANQLLSNNAAVLEEGAQDYLDYLQQLEDRLVLIYLYKLRF